MLQIFRKGGVALGTGDLRVLLKGEGQHGQLHYSSVDITVCSMIAFDNFEDHAAFVYERVVFKNELLREYNSFCMGRICWQL